jgi:isopentenyl-diphosphate delta-isomerase
MIKVAMLWLVNENKELLLARRADHKAQDPGLWGPSVTGKLEKDETFEEAIVRETEEELGLNRELYVPQYLFETDFHHPDGEIRQFKVFITEISPHAARNIHIDSNEVAEVKWLSIQEVKDLLNSKPGEIIVASAFVLWSQIFEALETKF